MFPTEMSAAEEALYKLNWIKDEVETDEKHIMMERYTANLKDLEQKGTIESFGRNDQLNRMFVPQKGSHHIGLHSRFSKNTGIKCTSDQIQPEVVLSYLGFHDGNYLEDGGWQAGPSLGDDKKLEAPPAFPCKSGLVGWQACPSLGDDKNFGSASGVPLQIKVCGLAGGSITW